MADDRAPKVVEDCHQFLLWIIPVLDNFPRKRRYSLGDRLESILIEVLELLVTAVKTGLRATVTTTWLLCGAGFPHRPERSKPRLARCAMGYP